MAVTSAPLVTHSYHAALWAALAALAAPWPFLLLKLSPAWLLAGQAGLFVLLCLVFALPPLARRLVPRREARLAAGQLARTVFLSHGLHQTSGRTGLLILVAPGERLVEVVADEGIHARLGADAWRRICAAVSERAGQGELTLGIEAAVVLAGDLLSGPFPRAADDRNEINDRVVLL
ncbi:TPM domain-containing protein [Aquabacter cavernae]|uniref:TPM domain-containing protein n=1 Tax=Aquabacter cavernae TaxID=2496029 RepID=UPI000F8F21D0|nr:hypothetical protein [Aquabacter cavernae]